MRSAPLAARSARRVSRDHAKDCGQSNRVGMKYFYYFQESFEAPTQRILLTLVGSRSFFDSSQEYKYFIRFAVVGTTCGTSMKNTWPRRCKSDTVKR